MSIDLAPHLLRLVKEIVHDHAPDCEVLAFGSRVTGRAKRFSDLDLALSGPSAISPRQMALLANAFEESDLPIKVDFLDLNAASPTLRSRILGNCEVV